MRWVRIGAALVSCGVLLAWGAEVASEASLQAPAPTPVVLDRTGDFITQAGHVMPGLAGPADQAGMRIEYGYWVVEPPPRVVAVTLALEDRRFWDHPGIDPLALARAVWQHATGRAHASGASTIAMQVARMQHPRPRTLWAKAVEAGVAVALVARYGHANVLAQYLRLAPYGDGSHGIGHAAWWYFGRPAADLNDAQAAVLAAVPQSPARLALHRHDARTARRAALALSRIGRSETDLAETQPLARWRRPDCTQLVLRLQARARALQAGLATPIDVPLLHAGIDLAVQNGLRAQLASQLQDLRTLGAQQAALMVVERRSGRVLAAIAAVPGAAGGAFDFLSTMRSPGSTEKPFFYALALDSGVLQPDELLLDAPGQAAGIANADHDFLGMLTPGQALANSRNVPAAALLRRIGLEAGFAYLRRLGLDDADAPPAIRAGLGLAIGAQPTTLERLVRAYAALASDGNWRELRWLDEEQATPPRAVMSEATSRLVTRFLSDPMARLPSFPRYGSSEYPLAVALKTGTSQGYRDAWTVAWSHDLLVGAWVGRPDAAPMAKVSGARAAARLVQTALLGLHGLGRSDLVAGEFAPGNKSLSDTSAPSAGGTKKQAVEVNAAMLQIVQPSPDTHVWRNQDLPAALDRLVLRATAAPGIRQVTWLVDGAPLATLPPDAALSWPMQPGQHRFQLRLPLARGVSPPVAITVE